MLTVKDIAWLTGLWEGEGSFLVREHGGVRMSITMTDRDVMERAAALLGGALRGPYRSKATRRDGGALRPYWTVVLGGKRAAGWMMTMYSLLGERRKAAVRKALEQWSATKVYGRKPDCHPERTHFGLGFCKTCYHRQYMRTYRAA